MLCKCEVVLQVCRKSEVVLQVCRKSEVLRQVLCKCEVVLDGRSLSVPWVLD